MNRAERRDRGKGFRGQRAYQPTASSVTKGRSCDPIIAEKVRVNIRRNNPLNLTDKTRARLKKKG